MLNSYDVCNRIIYKNADIKIAISSGTSSVITRVKVKMNTEGVIYDKVRDNVYFTYLHHLLMYYTLDNWKVDDE